MKTAFCIAVATAALAAPSFGAQVILNETFTDATRTLQSGQTDRYYIHGDELAWWTLSPDANPVDVNGSIGNPAESVWFSGTTTGTPGRIEGNLSSRPAFNTTNPEQNTITFGIDLRVDAYAASASRNFGLVVRDLNRKTGTDDLIPNFRLGFGRTTINGQSRLAFFGADTNNGNYGDFTPGAGHAIGWDAQDQIWAGGFDFGIYDANDAAANDTNDEFYRLEVTFNPFDGTSQTIDVIATQLSTGNQATLTQVVNVPFVFSNSSQSQLIVTGAWAGTLTGYVDNITVTVVPEPAALSVLSLGGLALLRRRRI